MTSFILGSGIKERRDEAGLSSWLLLATEALFPHPPPLLLPFPFDTRYFFFVFFCILGCIMRAVLRAALTSVRLSSNLSTERGGPGEGAGGACSLPK